MTEKMPVRFRWFKRFLLALAVLVIAWVLLVIALAWHIHRFGQQDYARPSDVIVVLGAGLQRNGSPGPALWRRSLHGADLYAQGYADRIICTGGQAPRQPRSEADACRDILVRAGVPAEAILPEERSRSTEENALYTSEILAANGWQTVLVVSDSYHVFRAQYLFDLYGIDAATSPVSAERIRGRSFYTYSILREIAALHWQVFKDAVGLQITYVP